MARMSALQREKRKNEQLEQRLASAEHYGDQLQAENRELRDRISYLHLVATNLGDELVKARIAGGEITTPRYLSAMTNLSTIANRSVQ